MNKKILFLIFLASILIFPFVTHASESIFCDMILKITKTAWWIGGSIVVIGWVIAGIIYLTAAGGSRLEIGKKALVAAVIGTVLIILSASAASLVQSTIGNGTLSQCGALQ